MSALFAGAIAGTVATVPMTVAMELMRDQSLLERYRRLPPAEITARIAVRSGFGNLDTAELGAASLVSHFGFGASVGALFGPIAQTTRRSPVVIGIAYGLGVWASSYLGWLPATGLFPPATRDTRFRTAYMIAAHVVWGAALGAVVGRLERRRGDTNERTTERSSVTRTD